MAMFEAATSAFVPGSKSDEVAALKAQIAELQAKVDKLG
jgi:hypothetical protein